MTAHFIFAATTAALRQVLHQAQVQGLPSGMAPCAVAALPPDRIEEGDVPVLSLALLRAGRDLALDNRTLPGGERPGGERPGDGRRVERRHFLLRYLLSLRGGRALDAELILGCIEHFVLHQAPVMTAQIERALMDDGAERPDIAAALREHRIGSRLQSIRLGLDELALAEETALWRALRQPLRPGLIVTASVAALS